MTGISAPYEAPENPDIEIKTEQETIENAVKRIIRIYKTKIKTITMSKYYLNYLDELESEAIFILREVWAQFENPVILFSGGKDSIVVTHLAKKAFYPSKIPFPLMHVDTGHNFPETIQV